MRATSRTALAALAVAVIVSGNPDALAQNKTPTEGGEGENKTPTEGENKTPTEAASPPSGAPSKIERPKLLVDEKPRYPAKAYEAQLEADVVVLLTLDATGAVTDVELATSAGHGFDEEALRAARKLRFTPARIDGTPTAVQIRYTFRFRRDEKDTVAKPPAKTCDTCTVDKRKPGTIKVTVFERGKGKRLAGVEVYLLDQDRVLLTDKRGQFEVSGPPGAYAFTIRPPGFYPYQASERIEAGETVELEYFVRRNRRDRFSTIVWGSEGRAEVGRTSLVEDEIRMVAGTMGDPLRVATLLPGSTSSASGLGYPIIRGSLPGESIYEIDGIYVPMLYHLLFGPAVIHPQFVDQIVFNPGGYSAEHGRFPGGRVGATTARVDDAPRWVADLSIIETSLLRSQKVGDSSEMVAAVRYGTLGYIIEGLAADIVFRYWDYQARMAHRFGDGSKLTLTVLGASDAAGEKDEFTGEEEVLRIGFHTADLRYLKAFGNAWFKTGAQVGHEFFEAPDDEVDGDAVEASSAKTQSVRPYLEVGWVTDGIEIKGGGDALIQDFGLDIGDDPDNPLLATESGVTLGVWAAAEIKLGKLLLNPSVRADRYTYTAPNRTDEEVAFDPRISAAYQITPKVAVKAAVGRFSGPPRLSFVDPPIVFGPVPGFHGVGLNLGLIKTDQAHAGVEIKLPRDLDLSVTGYYHDGDAPIDFSLFDVALDGDATACASGGVTTTPRDINARSYGAELLLRRKLGSSVYGWVSYAMSRSERRFTAGGQQRVIPFDFDQTHVFNGVVSWEVGRDWTLGGVLHINTGRPTTELTSERCGDFFYEGRRGPHNQDRLPGYWRIDLRVQKREVFENWFFDFYIDFFNAAFQFETIEREIDEGTGEIRNVNLPLFIPTIGIRGEF